MHICCLNMPQEFYSPVSGGAVATVIMEQTRQLLARGHRVTVLTPVSADGTHTAGDVVPLQVGRRDNLSFVQRRVSDVRQRLHRWDWPYYEYYLRSFTAALGKLTPAPDVVITHNDLISPQYIKKAVPSARVLVWLHNECRTQQRDMGRTLACVDSFVAVSRYIRDWTAEMYGLEPEQITNIPNGVDPETFRPAPDFLEAADALRVLYIGRFDPNKGPDLAADAVRALREEGLSIRLTVAGAVWWYGNEQQTRDPYVQSLSAKMDAAGATSLGLVPRAEVPALMRGQDVVCVLSRSHDPYPLVPLEAMSSGCAVLASDRGGLPEACGGAAMLVDPDDLESVIDGLRRLATDPELLRAQKRRSLERAARASWSERVSRLESLLTERRQPSPLIAGC